jgi:N-acetylmuramic acid 6-phosphate etherase
MSEASDQRSQEFLKISGQFKLGALVTESSHPVTANLSEVARQDIAQALDLLFQVDNDVIAKYREFAESGRAEQIKETVVSALKNGGKIFFTGCGSTGRLSILLDSVWRDFWQQVGRVTPCAPHTKTSHYEDFENRTFSVMAGGDFALIKSVEGFEDFAAFGKKQIADLGVSDKDVVFAITEGGETSFVIGTAWKGVEVGAKVYFVYNNPDDILCEHVERSREVIQDARIEKINLTTGPMAITGSTRMQATTIQLCVLLTVMEMVVRDFVCGEDSSPSNARAESLNQNKPEISSPSPPRSGGEGWGEVALRAHGDEVKKPAASAAVPGEFFAALQEMHANLRSPEVLSQLAKLVALEESVYRAGRKNNYYADHLGIDVLTDTTERSPTYCTPPFRKFDDYQAAESWAFLFLPYAETPAAWAQILKRNPKCVEWKESEVRELVDEEKFARTHDIVRKISQTELMRFKIGLDGVKYRGISANDSSVAVFSRYDGSELTESFLSASYVPSTRSAFIYFGDRDVFETFQKTMTQRNSDSIPIMVPCPPTDFLLDGVTRAGVKMLLNALSTCTMVRLGRVMGNYMIWVVASNLKLIDRATRYIQKLTGLTYEDANRLLFEVVEYIEPRMKSDQAYPPVVGMAVLRARDKLTNEQAEQQMKADLTGSAAR